MINLEPKERSKINNNFDFFPMVKIINQIIKYELLYSYRFFSLTIFVDL